MSEEEETNILPVVEKQGKVAGTSEKPKPFVVVDREPRTLWKTGYAYYLAQRAKNESMRPLIGRYTGDDKTQFQVYSLEAGAWEDKNFWDYSEAVKDDAGNVVMNKANKPKHKPFFEQKFEYSLQMESPTEVSYYNKELAKEVTEELTEFKVLFSRSLAEKIKEQLDDPRSPEGSKFVIDYDGTKAPAEQYKVRFFSE